MVFLSCLLMKNVPTIFTICILFTKQLFVGLLVLTQHQHIYIISITK